MTYAEFRDGQAFKAQHDFKLGAGPPLNNTGMSRQVRRARERQFEDAPLSFDLTYWLTQRYPGQGLFMQGRYRYPGWPNETRKPRRDNTWRYASLFKLPANAPDVQGRNGANIPEA